jgi:putative DNA primase/helicase
MDTYFEKSPSGDGLRGICEGKLPEWSRNKNGDFEAYDKARFVTITGNVYGDPKPIRKCQEEINWYCKTYLGERKPETDHSLQDWTVPEGELDQRLEAARRDQKLVALMKGETGDYPSASEVDAALVSKIAFYLGPDPEQIEALARKSALVRDKWDRRDGTYGTYLQRTIHTELARRSEYYQPSQTRPDIKDIVDLAYKGQRGCAELFARLYRGQLCFDHTDAAWFEFAGHYWALEKVGNRLQQAVDQVQAEFQKAERELDGEIVLLGQKVKNAEDEKAQEQLKRKLKGLEKQQQATIKLIQSLNSLAYRKQVVEFAAQGKGSLGISGDEWDLKPWYLPCPNGILDLKTGELRNGTPEDYLRAACPTSYNPHAKAPRWEQALQEIFAGDLDLIAFVQRVLGMALVGKAVEHKLIVLWGAGRNGKDTLLEALAHVLGPALAGAVQSELLLDQGRVKSSSGPSADVMRLRGLRVAWASETNEGRRLDAGKIKLLTGGGNLVGRSPYARYEVSFPQSHSLFLLTNSKPHAPSDDYALWKRLVLIPFTQSFVDDPQYPHEHKADKALPDKLKSETEGILAWLVRGCLEWQAQGLNPPALVQQATQDYRKEEDILLQFTEEACVQGPQCMAPAQSLYNHYRDWMQKNGLKPMSGSKFGRKMAERFTKERTTGGLHYMNIGILSE